MSQMTQEHLERVRSEVNSCLLDFCAEQRGIAATRSEAEARLWGILTDVIMAGGKRLRPYLVLLAYEGYGGTERDKIIKVAAGWEILHQAMLVHDDIIDRDYTRHGEPNVSGQLQEIYAENSITPEDCDHYANSGALLAGDLALSSAYQLFLQSQFDPGVLLPACRLLGGTINTVIGGELLDTEAVMQPIESTDSLLIAELKTASYSFVGPMQCGALLAGANENELAKLNSIGIALGVAFQLSDDLLGVFGDEKVTGKSISSDIHEGKRTLLVQYALEASGDDDRAFLATILGNPLATSDQIERFRKILKTSGAKEKVEKLVEMYLEQADDSLESLGIQGREFTERYEFLIAKLRQRKS